MPQDTLAIPEISSGLVDEFINSIQDNPKDLNNFTAALYDLKTGTVRKAAEFLDIDPDNQLVQDLIEYLPSFSIFSFIRTRTSILSLAIAVLVGWLVGGMLATLLGFLSLGGEIIRPICILGVIWLEDYLGANPKARKILLTALGLGGLLRFASSLTMGLLRLGSFTSIRSFIFGSIPKPGFFKSLWLWVGVIFVIALFAKKPSGIDYGELSQSLNEQVESRIKLCIFFFTQLASKEQSINELNEQALSASYAKQLKNHSNLALSLIDLLPQMNPKARNYLSHKLQEAGYELPDDNTDILIWNNERDRQLYDPIGLVRDGDKCKILRKPVSTQDKLVKGLAQRIS